MRRLLVAVLLVSGLAVPATAAPERRPVRHEPGRVSTGRVSDADWVDRQLEAIATRPIAQRILRRLDVARAELSAAEKTYRITDAFDVDDLDGDRVRDVLSYTTEVTFDGKSWNDKGWVEIGVLSGRTGVRRWQRRFHDMPYAMPLDVRVGAAGKPGLMLVLPFHDGNMERAYRVITVDGAKGRTVYDRTISARDGLGEVQWGGLMDGIAGGGTEVLIGRVTERVRLFPTWLRIETSRPYVVDGRNGKLFPVHDAVDGVSSRVTYLATGDLDGNGLDDYVAVRRGETDLGDVTAYTTIENGVLWERRLLPIGWAVRIGGIADMAGDKRDDFVLESWTQEEGPLEIEGVTDGVPLVDVQTGIHGLLFDSDGELLWDRLDGPMAAYVPLADIDRNGKTDVLSIAAIVGARDGVRFTAVTAAGKELYRKDVTVRAAVARRFSGWYAWNAGDVDADGVQDLLFGIYSASLVEYNDDGGYFLVRPGRVAKSGLWPFGGSLDGRGDEVVAYRGTKTTDTFTVRNGLGGKAYWSITLPGGDKVWWAVWGTGGGRGRCAGVYLTGYAKGRMWVAVLDGRTGRMRWRQTLLGPAYRGKVRASGPAAPCR